jgi:excisionase family DNA binding protein
MTQSAAVSRYDTPPPLLLSADRTARMLGISPRTVWTLCAAGEIPSVRLGKRRLFRISTIDAWLAARERAQPARKS